MKVLKYQRMHLIFLHLNTINKSISYLFIVHFLQYVGHEIHWCTNSVHYIFGEYSIPPIPSNNFMKRGV